MAGAYTLDFDWAPSAERTVLQRGRWDGGVGVARLQRLATSLALHCQVRQKDQAKAKIETPVWNLIARRGDAGET